MRVAFSEQAWDDYRYWIDTDYMMLKRLNRLIEDARRSPFVGLGKPEPLKGRFSGLWSRRLNSEHRLVYRIEGRPGIDQRIEIAGCHFHYDNL